MRLSNGWVDCATQLISPNFDDRPKGVVVEVLVVHSISLPPGKFGGKGIEQLFTNTLNPDDDPYYPQLSGLKVSCHFFVRRDGELIQFVCTDKRAWHCGVSTCLGRQKVNNFSIGIELEGLDNGQFTDPQYICLAALTKALQLAYPNITEKNIVGHEHIAPGRKTDPGCGFNWYHFLASIK